MRIDSPASSQKKLLGSQEGAALVGLVIATPLYAQSTPAIKRSILQKLEVPAGKKCEVVLGMAELPAGINIGKHAHPVSSRAR